MLGKVYRAVLKLRRIFVTHPVRLGQLVSERRREVAYLNAVLLGGLLSLALSCDSVGRQLCALSFKKIGYFNPERKRAFVNEGEGEICLALFVKPVVFGRHFGLFSHFFLGPAHYPAHFLYTRRNLGKLCQCRLNTHFFCSFFRKIKKTRLKVKP